MEGPLTGPIGTEKHLLVRDHPNQLVWLTGFSCPELLDGEGKSLSPRLLSQSNVDLNNGPRHLELMGTKALPNGRLFSLGQGLTQIALPSGFGIPLMSGEPLLMTTAVMNLDPYTPETSVSVVGLLDFTYQNGLERPMVPLWPASAYSLVSLSRKPACYGVEKLDPLEHGEGCSMLPPATDKAFTDAYRQRFAADWQLPRGESTTRTTVTRLLNLPYHTTLHYATVQLLPHARRVELRDRTELKALVVLEVESDASGALTKVPQFASAEGVEMFADHEYELIVTYLNTGRAGAPAKAAMHLYLRDKEFSVSGTGF